MHEGLRDEVKVGWTGFMIWLLIGPISLYVLWISRESITGWWFAGAVVVFISGTVQWKDSIKEKRVKKEFVNLYNERWMDLRVKYDDIDIVNRIANNLCWEGMTAGMLIDALGEPDAREESRNAGKSSAVWKYQQDGKNRFKTRVTISNGIVTGWQKRD